MKQVAQGHRATKWQSRDSLTHAAPTGAHSGPCTPARPPLLLVPISEAPQDRPHIRPQTLQFCTPTTPLRSTPGAARVRARSCPRGSRGRPGSRGGLASIHGASRRAGPGRAAAHNTVSASLPAGTRPLYRQRPSYGSLAESRGSARTKVSINVF